MSMILNNDAPTTVQPVQSLPMANLVDMVDWAARLMASRQPDFIIGDNYLRRWWVIPRNAYVNVYLHHILHSDDDRALHDHPWDNMSFVLHGDYLEHTPTGVIRRREGDVVSRKATDAHRLEIADGNNFGALSLFVTGPKLREWGFHCPNGWRHWTQFVNPNDVGQSGPGCE